MKNQITTMQKAVSSWSASKLKKELKQLNSISDKTHDEKYLRLLVIKQLGSKAMDKHKVIAG